MIPCTLHSIKDKTVRTEKKIHGYWAQNLDRGLTAKGHRELWENNKKMFYIFIVLLATQLYTFVKTQIHKGEFCYM